jgi:hypothetical protein
VQTEGQLLVIERGKFAEHELGECPEEAAHAVKLFAGGIELHAKTGMHVFIEVLKKCASRRFNAGLYCGIKLSAQFLKRGVNFLRRSALLVNFENAPLEVHAGLDSAQNFVRRAEYAIEEIKFFPQELKHTLVSCVPFVQEVDYNHVMFLAVTMAATDALLDALGIPWQIVVDHQRAELQVDALRACFRGDH